ncbi:protein SEED AND ROOT HAIR PROTECTIVE PROTEIN-like [Solanum dulcamara]|uniref:protein SEED AND ROOT HAIR PROTECTIVE PROTEIN-like n=1 Tax=Solanum dulcamara TaxID=45834 RepID=UPI0024868F72|nr:protein SEED AND ROOT HAIR PROTECTIVE PROTEIN-like [Solanum dulcamara]
MASSKNLPVFCILLSLVAAATIASANSNYENGYYGYGNNAPKTYKKNVPTKGLVPEANIIAVQGMIFCKSGSKYIPLKGAVARITCLGTEKNGYETAPFSFSSYQSDAKGYYYAVFSVKEYDESCTITQCKAFLESSSLEECDVPTDENKGKTGALLTSYRLLNEYANKKTLLYSVAPFVYTSNDDDYTKSNYKREGGY